MAHSGRARVRLIRQQLSIGTDKRDERHSDREAERAQDNRRACKERQPRQRCGFGRQCVLRGVCAQVRRENARLVQECLCRAVEALACRKQRHAGGFDFIVRDEQLRRRFER